MSFLEELKRRNIVKTATLYVVASWLILQVADVLSATLDLPSTWARLILAVLILVFPLVLIFSWVYEITPEGLKRESEIDRSQSITHLTGRKINILTVVLLVLAIAAVAVDRLVPEATTAAHMPAIDESEDAAATALPTDKSVAVLPLKNNSMQEDDEFFTAGIHGDLLAQLAQISSLRVISRTSVGRFKDTNLSIREIAEQLNVATVLEGGVQRAGNQVRINVQLIDAGTDALLWAQTFDRELAADNIFAIQFEIASAVADAMRTTLSPQEQVRIAKVSTENMAALEEYFKGRAEMDRRTEPLIESARLHFRAARTLDPEFASAWAGEAQAILLLSENRYGDIPVAQTVALARPLAERALQLSPDDSKVLAVNGLLESRANDFSAAIGFYRGSLDINPSDGEVLSWMRGALLNEGKFREAKDLALRMVEVDPTSIIALGNAIFELASYESTSTSDIEVLLQRLHRLDASYGLAVRAGIEKGRGNTLMTVRYYFQSLEVGQGGSTGSKALSELLLRLGLENEGLAVAPSMSDYAQYLFGNWDEAVRVARQNYDKSPDQPAAIGFLLTTLMWAGDEDAAFSLAQELWAAVGENPFRLYGYASDMAWVARQSGHPVEAGLYRDALAQNIQRRKEVGQETMYGYWTEAQLAALDGRDGDAITALSRSIDMGAHWQYVGEEPVFRNLRDSPGMQAQVERMHDIIEQERNAVLGMLCGPETILTNWEPTSASCEMYRALNRSDDLR